MAEPTTEPLTEYPVSLSIDYPDRDLDRLTTFFRPFVAIPILIIIGMIAGGGLEWPGGRWGWSGLWDWSTMYYSAAGILFLPTILMILFRQKYPRWWFDWNVAITKFIMRVSSYMLLMTDEYPSTDEEQAVHIEIPYPEVKELNRGLPLVKWLLAFPHHIVLLALDFAVGVCIIVAWFVILFTGRYPRSLFDFIVDVLRWHLRVNIYAFILTTDRYPPFSFKS